MKDFPSCFGENGVQVADVSCSSVNKASQNVVTCVYKCKLLGQSCLVTIIWSKNLMGQCLSVEIDDLLNQCLCKVDVKPSLFSKRKGSKCLEVNSCKIDMYWDLSSAHFGSGPEPLEGYYFAVVCKGELVLLIGDLRKEAFKKTNANPSLSNAMFISKREHIFGKRVYGTKAQFCDNGHVHGLTIECDTVGVSDPCLVIRVDSKMVMQVKHLRWKFRGNQTIWVDGLPVELFWDVHDWLFGTAFGNAVFMFQTCLSAEKLWASQAFSDPCIPPPPWPCSRSLRESKLSGEEMDFNIGHSCYSPLLLLWDLGQQRCVHSYAVHTDSVWALASTSTFSHVYSGGRDLSLYLTDLATRESILLCTKEHPISQLALHDDGIWVATTDSSVHKWPAEGRNPQKVFQRGGSFLAGNLSFSRARASLEGSTPVPVFKEPSFTIPGTPGIVQHEILNNRRHVLTKDTTGSVKLWEITRGIVVKDYGEVSFDEKKEELFEMVSIPAWFTVDTRLGSLSVHLDTPQCFSAEMYSADLNIVGKPEDDKVNLARETLKGLLAHWLTRRRQRFGSQASANGEVSSGKDISARSHTLSRIEVDGNAENDSMVYPPFEFSTASSPSIITEGSQGGPWRKKITDLDGTEDEKDFPWWCLDCVLNNRLPPRENTKCSFYLHPCEGSAVQILTQGKLSAPRILRMYKVINYVVEKMVLDKPLDNTDGTFAPGLPGGQLQHPAIGGDGSFRSGLKPWQKIKPSIEILCNNQVLPPDMSLATVRAYIWKKSEDLVLNYRVVQGR